MFGNDYATGQAGKEKAVSVGEYPTEGQDGLSLSGLVTGFRMAWKS